MSDQASKMASLLKSDDPELFGILTNETNRQKRSLELIASENFVSEKTLFFLGSVFTNKYSEGYPGNRYYSGNEFIDDLEYLTQKRALKAFGLLEENWGVNVQPYSGSPANLAVFLGLLQPHDRIMGLSMQSGGHLTHGHYTNDRRVNVSSVFYESLPYTTDENGLIDMEDLRSKAMLYRPKMIIAGSSGYPRIIDFAKFREICDEVNAYLLVDIAHYAGLVAGNAYPSPFPYADIVTSTTHKTLRGPRSGLIFFNLKHKDNLKSKINSGVFPTLQGGPHNHQIAALCSQFKEVCSPAWSIYAKQVVANAKHLAEELMRRGVDIWTKGTDCHMILINCKPDGLTGTKLDKVFDLCSISASRSTLPCDGRTLNCSGVRVGTSALTTRGFLEKDFSKVADYIVQCIDIAKKVQEKSGKPLAAFIEELKFNSEIPKLKEEIENWVASFPFPNGNLLS